LRWCRSLDSSWVFEFEFKLQRIDAFGFSRVDATTQQFDLLEQSLISLAQTIALTADVRKPLVGNSELLSGCRKFSASVTNELF
jgi:hypothetical protein